MRHIHRFFYPSCPSVCLSPSVLFLESRYTVHFRLLRTSANRTQHLPFTLEYEIYYANDHAPKL